MLTLARRVDPDRSEDQKQVLKVPSLFFRHLYLIEILASASASE